MISRSFETRRNNRGVLILVLYIPDREILAREMGFGFLMLWFYKRGIVGVGDMIFFLSRDHQI